MKLPFKRFAVRGVVPVLSFLLAQAACGGAETTETDDAFEASRLDNNEDRPAPAASPNASTITPTDESTDETDRPRELEPAGGESDVAGITAPVRVHLIPQSPSSTKQRVNFAVPVLDGVVTLPVAVRVRAAGVDVPATGRALARYPSGYVRSVQVQLDLALTAERDVDVELGVAGPVGPAIVPVAETLVVADGSAGPRVWALLPASALAASGAVGPMKPSASVPAGPLKKWESICAYTSSKYSTDAFMAQKSDRAVWLYDRGTAFYRGYAATGSLATLRSAYRETSLYRSTSYGTGTSFRIGVPGASSDLKYHYAQNLAIHYLLTGDDRFRETAENVAVRAAALWNPNYDGSSTDFWTERNAGFLLLAQVWAAIVSDDRAATFRAAADATFDASVAVQNRWPTSYTDPNARCFAHHGDAHDASEGNPYFGCSPWMSAILADGIDAYSRETTAARKSTASQSLVKLGRMFSREGFDPANLRPHYWMGVGTSQDRKDSYDEHRGEFAYVLALAWHHTGRTDAALKAAADKFAGAFSTSGYVGQLRSFNWQCRSGVATPALL